MAQLGALEAMRSGTTPGARGFFPTDVDDYAGALAETGMALPAGASAAYDRIGTSIGDPAPYKARTARWGQRHLKTVERNFRDWNGKAKAASASPCRPGHPTCARPSCLQDVRALQQQLDTWVTIHLNQIWGARVAAVKAHRNRLPTEYLADLGFLHDRLICAHCRCMEPAEGKASGRGRRHRLVQCRPSRRGGA